MRENKKSNYTNYQHIVGLARKYEPKIYMKSLRTKMDYPYWRKQL